MGGDVVIALAASRRAVPGGGSHCGGFRFAKTPLRCSGVGRAAKLATRFALRSNSRGEHVTTRAARADTPPCASRHRRDRPHRAPPAAKPGLGIPPLRANSISAKTGADTRQCASKALSSARASVGARSALRALTHCGCLSGARKARAASSAVRPNPEQRKAVAAGDRFSEALTGVRARLCREVQRKQVKASRPRRRK